MSEQTFIKGLYLVATPIGNLGDISARAVEVLKTADLIACEDTRVTSKLLSYLGISAKLTPYHEHNAEKVRPQLMERLKNGESLSLDLSFATVYYAGPTPAPEGATPTPSPTPEAQPTPTPTPPPQDPPKDPGPRLPWLALLLLLALMLLLAWRARVTEPMYRAARAKDDAAALLLLWQAALQCAAQLGKPRQHAETPLAYAARLGDSLGVSLHSLPEAVSAVQYGRHMPSSAAMREAGRVYTALNEQLNLWQKAVLCLRRMLHVTRRR